MVHGISIDGEHIRRERTRPAYAQFERAYRILLAADEARDKDDLLVASKLYKEALETYVDLSKKYPDWQRGVIHFRIAYCDNQIRGLLKRLARKKAELDTPPPATETGPAKGAATTDTGTADTEPAPAEAVDAGTGETTRVALVRPGTGPVEKPPSKGGADLARVKKKAGDLLAKGKPHEANEVLLEGLRSDPDDTTVRLLIGVARCQAGNYRDAVFLLRQLVDDDPTNTCAHVTLGTAYFGLGLTPEARKQMELAIKVDPNAREAHHNLAQILLRSKPPDIEGAKRHYKKAVDLGAPRDPKMDLLIR
jgi:tetratricopeptide (TPR) repeat protein